MGLAATLVRRSLGQRPGRAFFSALGIALGIATVVAVRTLDHNTVSALRLRHGGDWRPELEVRPAPGVGRPREVLGEIEGVAGAAAFFQGEAVLSVPTEGGRGRGAGRSKRVRARLLAVDARDLASLDAHRLIAGHELDPEAAVPQVLVGEAVARALGLAPGAQLEIARPARTARRACIDGVIQEVERSGDAPPTIRFEVAGVLAREKLGRRAEGEVVLVDHGAGLRLFEDARVEDRYWVRPAPAVDIERLEARLAPSFAYDIGRSAVVGEAADERAFRQGVLMAGLLALALGLYVIFHTLSMSLVERVREIGTLAALGTTRAQVGRVVLLEALVLAGLGGLLGLAGGLGVAWLLASRGITTLGSGMRLERFEVPWGSALAIAALGVSLALAGSVFPLLRARGTSVAQALRGEQSLGTGGARGFHLFAAILLGGILPALYFTVVPVIGQPTRALIGVALLGVGVLSLVVVVPLVVPSAIRPLCRALAPLLRRAWPFSGRMAAHAMLADPRRVAVSAAAVALVAAAFVALKSMTASLAGEVDRWADEAVAKKLYVEDLPRVPFDELAGALRERPEVLGVEAGSARTYSPFLLIGLRASEVTGYGPLRDDPVVRRDFERGIGVVLSRRLARNLGYAVGDRVQVATGAGVKELFVLAVSDAYGYFPHPDERMYGVVDERFVERAFCLEVDTVDRVAVRLRSAEDAGAVAAALREFLGGESPVELETGESLRRRHVEDIGRDFFLFDVILGLTALLAGVGVLNGQLLAALERTKELGVLAALGASRRQIGGMVLIESAAIGLFGGLIGVGLGNLLGPLVVRGIGWVSGLELPRHGAGAWSLVVLAGALLLALAAALYPVFRIHRLDKVKAVRTG